MNNTKVMVVISNLVAKSFDKKNYKVPKDLTDEELTAVKESIEYFWRVSQQDYKDGILDEKEFARVSIAYERMSKSIVSAEIGREVSAIVK